MQTAPFRLDGKNALVTGAAQGIGRAVALALASAGATVSVTDVPSKESQIVSVCEEVRARGGTAFGYGFDVTHTAVIAEVFEKAAADMGGFDVLVNNAGVAARGPAIEQTEEQWDRVLSINLKGMFFCAQAAARYMKDHGGGRIINTGSQVAESARVWNAAYTASKGGVVAMTRGLAVEWVQYGINVNAVGPGPVETELVSDTPDHIEAQVAHRSPIGRRLDPEDIAGAFVYLASPAASGVVGHHLLVDGGWVAG
ncbi:MAG TPA: SDR family oxidoreductase [Dehalococcoidia bacterium]|jgi:NAD(P)-dependent dehydrogenase (short-subunit alcohol dehydrogenase family)|nr:SDR family oxidoreductase [Dehalococcoidia bacterium]MDP7160517.1 SDR family oxidoreductase [Dehalococcoidia bacterium]MDP7213096.1 SDR family oxidoreductase [Dehalococcoidia bacterium]HJM52638.1 SDR family oxidoreductase [Dehalococcoidia bacterium]|tara:strand:- start:94 stop:858 length:765 start_codon:yes stop_codon:yes gene_type:complete